MDAAELSLGESHPLSEELASLRALVERFQTEAHASAIKLQRHALDTSASTERIAQLEADNALLRAELAVLRDNPASESDKDRERDRESAAELTLALRRLSSKLTLTEGSLATALASLASANAQNRGQTLAAEQAYALAARLRAQVEEGLQREEGLKEEAESAREEAVRDVERAREEARRSDGVVREYAALVRKLEGRPPTTPSASAARFSFDNRTGNGHSRSASWNTEEGSANANASTPTLVDPLPPSPESALATAKPQVTALEDGPHVALKEDADGDAAKMDSALSLSLSTLTAERDTAQTQLTAAQTLIAELGAELAKVKFEREVERVEEASAGAKGVVERYMRFTQQTTTALHASLASLRARHAATLATLQATIAALERRVEREGREVSTLRTALDDAAGAVVRESVGRRREVGLRVRMVGREERVRAVLGGAVLRAERYATSVLANGDSSEGDAAVDVEEASGGKKSKETLARLMADVRAVLALLDADVSLAAPASASTVDVREGAHADQGTEGRMRVLEGAVGMLVLELEGEVARRVRVEGELRTLRDRDAGGNDGEGDAAQETDEGRLGVAGKADEDARAAAASTSEPIAARDGEDARVDGDVHDAPGGDGESKREPIPVPAPDPTPVAIAASDEHEVGGDAPHEAEPLPIIAEDGDGGENGKGEDGEEVKAGEGEGEGARVDAQEEKEEDGEAEVTAEAHPEPEFEAHEESGKVEDKDEAEVEAETEDADADAVLAESPSLIVITSEAPVSSPSPAPRVASDSDPANGDADAEPAAAPAIQVDDVHTLVAAAPSTSKSDTVPVSTIPAPPTVASSPIAFPSSNTDADSTSAPRAPVAIPSPPVAVAFPDADAAPFAPPHTQSTPTHPLLADLAATSTRYDTLQLAFRDCHLALQELRATLAQSKTPLTPPTQDTDVLRSAVERLHDYTEDARVELEIRVADGRVLARGWEAIVLLPGRAGENEGESTNADGGEGDTRDGDEGQGGDAGADADVRRQIATYVARDAETQAGFRRKLEDVEHDIAVVKRAVYAPPSLSVTDHLESPPVSVSPASATPKAEGWAAWLGGVGTSSSGRKTPPSPGYGDAPTFGSVMTSPRLRHSSSAARLGGKAQVTHAPVPRRLHSRGSSSDRDPFESLGLRVPMPTYVQQQHKHAPASPQARQRTISGVYMLGLGVGHSPQRRSRTASGFGVPLPPREEGEGGVDVDVE